MSENEPFGYQINLQLGQDRFTLAPTLTYKYDKNITFSLGGSIDTKKDVKLNLGVQFQISKNRVAAVTLISSNDNYTHLSSTGVVLTYIYQGYVLKVPVFTTDQGDNLWGLGFTVGLFAATSFAAYKNLQYVKSRKPIFTRSEYNIAFGHY